MSNCICGYSEPINCTCGIWDDDQIAMSLAGIRGFTGEIARNSAKCKKCGDHLVSRDVHDYKECSCGSLSIDGGKDYLKRCGNKEDYEDTSIRF